MGGWQGALETLVMDNTFWQNKKVLVTGHTGFKGGWLALWLHSMGAKVVGYALPPNTDPNLFELTRLKEDVISYEGDVRDFNALHAVIKQEKPELVFHLAAQPLVRYSYSNPIDTYSTNVMGTVNLLEALRQVKCARVAIIVTSDKCYENREWEWGYRESEPMGGHDPYSSSKGCAELVTDAYRHSYFTTQTDPSLFIASVRAGNVIGGGDWATDRLVPDFFRAMMMGEPLKIRNPHAIRPWQHVLEPLSGYLLLAERLWQKGNDFIGGWNFGCLDQDAKPVEWIADYLTKLWGNGAHWQLEVDHEKLHEARYLKLDISKARLKLQWKPRWSIEEALALTVSWYKAYCERTDLRDVMYKQIISYQSI